ncbi:MAG: NfeD family protein [Paraclostridium sp.]
MFLIWIIIGIALLIVEATTVSFISVFFAIGCFVASLVSLVIPSIGTQIVVMCIVSGIGTIFCRNILQKYFEVNKEIKPSTINAMLGKTGVVTNTITPDNMGLVKVEGAIWSAATIDFETLSTGANITVVDIDGVKLIVKSI